MEGMTLKRYPEAECTRLSPGQVVTVATKGGSKQVERESTKAQPPIRLREGRVSRALPV